MTTHQEKIMTEFYYCSTIRNVAWRKCLGALQNSWLTNNHDMNVTLDRFIEYLSCQHPCLLLEGFLTVRSLILSFNENVLAANAHWYPIYWVSLPTRFVLSVFYNYLFSSIILLSIDILGVNGKFPDYTKKIHGHLTLISTKLTESVYQHASCYPFWFNYCLSFLWKNLLSIELRDAMKQFPGCTWCDCIIRQKWASLSSLIPSLSVYQ